MKGTQSPPIRLLLLDLDDTLLDTSGLLVPQAHKEAVQAMIDAGLKGPFDLLLEERLTLAKTTPPDVLAQAQATKRGAGPEVAKAGFDAYFDRDVGDIHLEAGVEDCLRGLMDAGRRLVLVTSGVEATQRQKVEALGLGFLHECHYVAVGGVEVKEAAFRDILTRLGCPPQEAVVIGDRRDSEILAANHLGTLAIWVRRGEHMARPMRGEGGRYDLAISGPLEIPEALRALERTLAPTGPRG